MVKIVSDPTIMSGDWAVEGTRAPAITIAAHIHAGLSDAEIRENYPTLPDGAIDAVRRWMTGAGVDYDRRPIRNTAHCFLCHRDIESRHGHDFQPCRCHNIAVDGGHAYWRRSGAIDEQGESWVDTSIFVGDQE
jgi:uncharacterized protein (DUF433 family)